MKYKRTLIAEAAKFTGLKNDKYPSFIEAAIDDGIISKNKKVPKGYYYYDTEQCLGFEFKKGDWIIMENDKVYIRTDAEFKKIYKAVK